jgi:hypothetical protein
MNIIYKEKQNYDFKQFLLILMIFGVSFLLIQDYANARDLVEAAQTAQTTFNRIGVAAISIGITLGGILFTIGAANVGRMFLISGGIGAVVILGAPTLVNLLAKFFGVSV